MKKKVLIGLSVVLLFLLLLFLNNEKYEYMVVSFGHADFTILQTKLSAYWEDGISKEAYEAPSYENNLDILGKQRWEVVSVTGAIGGEQQVMLKRTKNLFNSSKDAKKIEENKLSMEESLEKIFDDFKK
jgi:hypothetical protein